MSKVLRILSRKSIKFGNYIVYADGSVVYKETKTLFCTSWYHKPKLTKITCLNPAADVSNSQSTPPDTTQLDGRVTSCRAV